MHYATGAWGRASSRNNRLHFSPTEGERAGLVEDDGIDPAQSLQIKATFDDGAKARRATDASHCQRCAGSDAARARNDYYGNR